MVKFKRISLCSLLSALIASIGMAQSEHVVPPQVDHSDTVKFEMGGTIDYFHRHQLEVEGVPAERQAIYQSTRAGELDVRVSGLQDQPYRVRLEYVEQDMNAPRQMYFNILLNGEVVQREVNIFGQVGNRRVLTYDFTANPKDGVITYGQRIAVTGSFLPVFGLMQIYDMQDRLWVSIPLMNPVLQIGIGGDIWTKFTLVRSRMITISHLGKARIRFVLTKPKNSRRPMSWARMVSPILIGLMWECPVAYPFWATHCQELILA